MSTEISFDMWSAQYQDDLYRTYKTLRDDEPVYEYRPDSDGIKKCWILTRYDDVRDTFRDKVNFKNAGTRNDLIPQLQSSDGALHKGLRSQVFPKLLASAISHIEPTVGDIVKAILDKVEANGSCELMREVAFQIPRQVVPVLLGFPDHLAEKIVELVDPLAGYDPQSPVFPTPTLGDDFIALVDELIAFKQENPANDVMTELLKLEANGEVEPGGTAMIARNFGFAAFDTTINLLANGTVLLADNPQQRETLINNPELMPQAIAEILRLESPAQMIPRLVQRKVELHGQELAVGDEVLLLIGAANRDERQFAKPDSFDIGRSVKDHIAFGTGIHTCVGRHLAILEATVYFSELLRRFPHFQVNSRRYKASGWSRSFAEIQFSCT